MSPSDWQSDRPLVVDTNTVLSGLIGGVTRSLLFELDRELCYPEPSLDEIYRNRSVIQERAGLSATAIDELFDRSFNQSTVNRPASKWYLRVGKTRSLFRVAGETTDQSSGDITASYRSR